MVSSPDIVPIATKGMTFDDEFNTFTSSADGSSGTWMTNYPFGGENAYTLAPNGEQEYYSSDTIDKNSPFSLSGGVLNITATAATAGQNPNNLAYTSGLITTDKSFSQQYGYFEVNAQLPAGQGLWPAFWLLPANGTSPAELDVFEQLGSNPSVIYSTTHGWNGTANDGVGQTFSVANTSSSFHTYGVDWEPTTVTFYMDGVALGATPTPSSMNSPMYMLLNLAVGGAWSWGGAPDTSTVLPASMKINWVRAYATAATTAVGGSAAIASPTVTIGSGSDTLCVTVNEDAYKGDAQFTISVDGVQVGGVQTTMAVRGTGATQNFDVFGSFAPGSHTVSVTFVNDLYNGTATTDRNLYVTQASLNGSVICNSARTLMSNGSQTVNFVGDGTASGNRQTVTLGSGSGMVALQVSEDAYLGNAQFTVSIDGNQVGGVQTATAIHGNGETQAFDVMGNFAPGAHTVSVNFLNDAYGGSPSLDRNLYVSQASVNNASIAGSSLTEYAGGARSFTFQTATDTLTLGVSEDAYQGDAQYKVLVDGNYVGGTYTATASHAAGQINTQTVTGNWGAGPHTVGVQFINDNYGGSSSLDRNLYINSASYDGAQVTTAPVEQAGNGTANIAVASASALTLHLAEDAYQGDAQFTVSIDGQQVDQPSSVGALHNTGASQAFSFASALSVGKHDVSVSFLNDAYAGSADADRNLYVTGADLNGTSLNPSSWTATFLVNGTAHFSLIVPS